MKKRLPLSLAASPVRLLAVGRAGEGAANPMRATGSEAVKQTPAESLKAESFPAIVRSHSIWPEVPISLAKGYNYQYHYVISIQESRNHVSNPYCVGDL